MIEILSKRQKGDSIIEFPDTYFVVDLETTGLDPEFDEIIEMSALKVRNEEILSTFSTLVKPSFKIDSFIEDLTGITNAMLENQPSISEVLPQFLDFVGDQIIAGYNTNFDVNFIYDNCLNLGLPPFKNDFIDIMRMSIKLFPELNHHRLKDMVEYFEIPDNDLHRSEADCICTLACYRYIKEEILKQFACYEDFSALFSKRSYKLDPQKLSASKTEFDTTHPLYKKLCVFTGKLEKMVREDAMQIVLDLGGLCGNSVTTKTNYLILGNNDYCSSIKGGKSNKQKRAEELMLKGQDIQIITENIFYDLVNC